MNFCSRLEASSAPDCINLSAKTHERVKDFFACERRENVRTKDGVEVDMYFAQGILPNLLSGGESPPAAFKRRYQIYFRRDLGAFPPGAAEVQPA